MSKFSGIQTCKQIMNSMNRNYSSTRSGHGNDKGKGKYPKGPLVFPSNKSTNAPTPKSPTVRSFVPLPGSEIPMAEQLFHSSGIGPSEILPSLSPSAAPTKKKKKFPFPNMDDQGLPLLTPKDCFRRVEFASKMLNILEKDPTILDSILFTDEGNFHLAKLSRKTVPGQEYDKGSKRIDKSNSKGRKVAESQPLPQIVWCGMTSKHAIGPYFFNSYVTDRTYLKMLRSYVIPQMQRLTSNRSIDECWFQQDGAPPHRSKLVLPDLTRTFGSRLISYGCPLAWPPKSQDLTPLDYFFWNHLKEKLKLNYLPLELNTRKDFRTNLAKEIDDIDEKTLKLVIDEFPMRLEKCVESNGNRFEMDT